jgi:hypothetical protein
MAALATSFLLGGCVVGAPAQGLPFDGDYSPVAHASPTNESTGPAPSSRGATVDSCAPVAANASRADKVCATWRCARREVETVAWSGSTTACDPGDFNAASRIRALELVNAYRFLAEVPPVDREPTWEPAAQECALVAHANARLSHTPAESARCFTPLAAKASFAGLLANRNAPVAIGPFIGDPGNDTTMVHRRWLLQEELPAIGIGSTERYACIVVDGTGIGEKRAKNVSKNARGWVAWPPAGPVPLEVFTADEIDTFGWTLQTTTQDLAGAKVEVKVDGMLMPVHTSALEAHRGSFSAIRFVPDGWTTESGRRYDVSVKRGGVEIAYTVEPVGCR